MNIFAKKDSPNINYLKMFVFFSPFLFGGYHIWVSAVFSVVLFVYMIAFGLTDKRAIKQSCSLSFLSVVLIPLAYLVVSLWAVDSSTAVYGFVKFLPIGLFAAILLPLGRNEKLDIMDAVPYSAATMGIFSYVLSFLPSLSEHLLVASRLGGFFQYPNSFACYCLVGIPIILLKDKLTYKSWILSALLIGIILLTGSRTVFLLLAVTLFFIFIRIQSKHKIKLALLFVGAIAVSFAFVLITDSVQTIGRYLTISFESSTLLGRLLYYKDVLPVIAKHPFGLGYYGYYFSQGSFQHGVYSTAFVHNDFLQLFVDIGWIPALLFMFTVIRSVLSKNTGITEKFIIIIISVHSFFDFDLQFISVFLLLILSLDLHDTRLVSVSFQKKTATAVLASVILVSVYFGAVNGLFLLRKYDLVDKIYGKDTQSQIFLMTNEKDYENINSYAQSIVSRNKYVSIAYSAMANYAFKNGEIEDFIEYKEKAIACSLYSIDEYNDYCEKLITAINIYLRSGDKKSAEFCATKLIGIEKSLSEVKEKTDSIAWKIKDKPELELRKEYSEYIKEITR